MKTSALISGLAITALSLAACGDKTGAPKTLSTIKPAQNKMVVLPMGMSLGSAVIHPPRATDGFGDMQTQTIGAFNGLHALLKRQDLTLANVMRVRATLTAGQQGSVDYDGYIAGYKKFFGTNKLPSEPLHIISAVQSLPVTGQSILIEADIAVPRKTPEIMSKEKAKL